MGTTFRGEAPSRTGIGLSGVIVLLGFATFVASCATAGGPGTSGASSRAGEERSLQAGGDSAAATLLARAVLPADTFAEGPASGRYLNPAETHGRALPFKSQPVQGFSALVPDAQLAGVYLALVDNGFGAMENSADSHLRVYRVRPDFARGSVEVLSFIELRDPDRLVPFAIVNHFTPERVLTGADFDVESMQRADDGTLWFGDEFGPFLLHTDASGRLLEAPISVPDFERGAGELRSPQHPATEEGSLLRVLNAVRAHALAHGAPAPAFSPWHALVADGDAASGAPERLAAERVSSELADLELLDRAGFVSIPFTVNEPARMRRMLELGARGIISDRPDLLLELARTATPHLTLPDGRIDRSHFDAQGHRGARGLRPENTLPAMEAALDALVTTIESDVVLTGDGVAVLWHDFHLDPGQCRRADGERRLADLALIKAMTLAQLQRDYVCDRVAPEEQPAQVNDVSLSPVSVAFTRSRKLRHSYVVVSVRELFDFVAQYAAHYETGAGRAHPDAKVRAANAREVRFNLETKVNPRRILSRFSPDPVALTDALVEAITHAQLTDRVDVQSFDWSTLLHVHRTAPRIRTVMLLGDFAAASGRGNLAPDDGGANTPWLAGLPWPWRRTWATAPPRVRQSGGFEGMAYDRAEGVLVPLLEKPLVDAQQRELIGFRFDLGTKTFTGQELRFPLHERATSVGDFQLQGIFRGVVLERDDTQGDPAGYKRLVGFTRSDEEAGVKRSELADLLRLQPTDATRDVVPGPFFSFPFVTIESVVPLREGEYLIANDNNFPFSVGRHLDTGEIDDTEFIVIRVGRDARSARAAE